MVRGVLSQVVKVTAEGVDLVRPRRHGVTVLLYHRVGAGTGASVDLEPARFEAQVAAIADRYDPMSLDEAVGALGEESGVPADSVPDSVVVTFDDGTADFVDRAVPVLAAYGVPATVYVATQLVESGGTFPGGAPMVSWAALRDAASTGLVTVGSHTHTHRLLDRASVPDAIDELDRSRGLIEERLGTAARHFAYPKAQLGSPAVETEVRSRFASAAVAGTRPNPYGATDVFRLARSPIQRSDAMRWFHRKARGGMATEDHLRRFLDRRRLADAVT